MISYRRLTQAYLARGFEIARLRADSTDAKALADANRYLRHEVESLKRQLAGKRLVREEILKETAWHRQAFEDGRKAYQTLTFAHEDLQSEVMVLKARLGEDVSWGGML